MDDFKYAYDIFNFRYLYDQCMVIMQLMRKYKKIRNKRNYSAISDKINQIKSLIIKKGSKSLSKLCKLYNDGVNKLRDHGNAVVITTGIDEKLILYRKRLIQWTISGQFHIEYKSFKTYYKNNMEKIIIQNLLNMHVYHLKNKVFMME